MTEGSSNKDYYHRYTSYVTIQPGTDCSSSTNESSNEEMLYALKQDLKAGIHNVKNLWMPRRLKEGAKFQNDASPYNVEQSVDESFHLTKYFKCVERSTATKLYYRTMNGIYIFNPKYKFRSLEELSSFVEKHFMRIQTRLRSDAWIETSGIVYNHEEIETLEVRGDIYEVDSIEQVKSDIEACGIKVTEDFLRRPFEETPSYCDQLSNTQSVYGDVMRSSLSGLLNQLKDLYRLNIAPKTISAENVFLVPGTTKLDGFEKVFAYEENQAQNLKDLKDVFESNFHKFNFEREVDSNEFLDLLSIMVPTNLAPINHLNQLKFHPTLLSNARNIALVKTFVCNLEDNGERSDEEKMFLEKLKIAFLEHCRDYSNWRTEAVLGERLYKLLQDMTDIARKKKPGAKAKLAQDKPAREENVMTLIRELRHRVSNCSSFFSKLV